MKTLFLPPSLVAAITILSGCSSFNHGFNRSMDYKDKVADSKTGNAAIAMGGHYKRTTTTDRETGDVVVTESWSATAPGGHSSFTRPDPGPLTTIPGGGVLRIGAFIENPGSTPISVDPATMAAALGRGASPLPVSRQVTPTEKLAMLSMYYGEDGRFIPKDAFGQTLETGEQILKIGALWDIGTRLIDYSDSVTANALDVSEASSQSTLDFAQDFEPFVVPQ